MENLLRPWVLALLLAAGGAVWAWVRGLVVAEAILRRFRPEVRDEPQIQLERQAELGARWVSFGAYASAAAFLVLVFGADHAAAEIRGAMCAHGVLASTRAGFAALALSLAVFAAGIVWTQLHRLDLELRTPSLTRPKFVALLALAPLSLAALLLDVDFVRELDFGVVATCCSSSADAGEARVVTGASAASVTLPLYLAPLGLAMLVSIVAAIRPARALAAVAGAASVGGVLAAIPALVHVVAPHVYETPSHRCLFCLLHFPEARFGLPIYASMLFAFFAGSALLVRATDPRWPSSEAASPASRLGKRAAIGLAAVLATMLAPVIRYAVVTGGASLFGGP